MKMKYMVILGILLIVVTSLQVSAYTRNGVCKGIGEKCSDTKECCPNYLTDHGNFYGYCNLWCRPADGLSGNYNELEWCNNILSGLYDYYSNYNEYASSNTQNFLGWNQGTSCSDLFYGFGAPSILAAGQGFSGNYNYLNNLIGTYDENSNRIETNYYDTKGYGGAYATDSAVSGINVVSKDPSGKVLQAIDANKNKVRNYYDPLDRLIKSEYYKNNQVNFKTEYYYDTYSPISGEDECAEDENGDKISSLNLLCEVRDDSGHTKFIYDQRARVIRQEKTIYEKEIPISDRTYVLEYKYDSANNLIETTLPDQKKIFYYYNDIGQLGTITYGSTEQDAEDIADLSYNEFGAIDQKVLGSAESSITADFTYNPKQLLTSLNFIGNTFNFGRTMAYDLIGNVKKISYEVSQSDPGEISGLLINEAYNYDNLYRLNETTYNVQGVSSNIKYNYKNLWGDRSNMVVSNTPGLTSTLYTYDNNFKLLSSIAGNQQTSYNYDWTGNIIGISGSETSAFTYDALSRMTESTTNDIQSQYTYDYTNQRVKKNTPSEVTFYLYQGNNVIYEETVNLGTPACPVVCGDFDADGQVTLDDFNYLLNYFYGVLPAKNLCAADVNNDGIINGLDLTYLVQFIENSGPAPVCNFNAVLAPDVGGSISGIKLYLYNTFN